MKPCDGIWHQFKYIKDANAENRNYFLNEKKAQSKKHCAGGRRVKTGPLILPAVSACVGERSTTLLFPLGAQTSQLRSGVQHRRVY